MWRTLGREQIVSTAGMRPLSTLHGGESYSTWPQDGSKDRRDLCAKTGFILAAKYQTAKHANSIKLFYLQFRFSNVLF